MDRSGEKAPSLDDFEVMARDAFAALPETFRALAGDVVFRVADFPDDDVVRDMGLESEFDILGLFHGPELAAHRAGNVHAAQTMIFLYRRPILDYWAEHDERLGDVVRHVLIHEIGHHFGLSDDDMEAIENAAA
ncbi:MAG TPA: metallopeptidase family protein [Rhizomicrobium sp.]|jgi:predicted Zn-dependent protease with MMP-like domain|nr:metallopeptidase family protein [Rhizomicrobium sp.]